MTHPATSEDDRPDRKLAARRRLRRAARGKKPAGTPTPPPPAGSQPTDRSSAARSRRCDLRERAAGHIWSRLCAEAFEDRRGDHDPLVADLERPGWERPDLDGLVGVRAAASERRGSFLNPDGDRPRPDLVEGRTRWLAASRRRAHAGCSSSWSTYCCTSSARYRTTLGPTLTGRGPMPLRAHRSSVRTPTSNTLATAGLFMSWLRSATVVPIDKSSVGKQSQPMAVCVLVNSVYGASVPLFSASRRRTPAAPTRPERRRRPAAATTRPRTVTPNAANASSTTAAPNSSA